MVVCGGTPSACASNILPLCISLENGPTRITLTPRSKFSLRDINQSLIFPIVQIFKIVEAITIIWILGREFHDVGTKGAVGSIFVQKEKSSPVFSIIKGRAFLAKVDLPVPAWPEKRMRRGAEGASLAEIGRNISSFGEVTIMSPWL